MSAAAVYCPHCGGTKEKPQLSRRPSDLFADNTCASKFHLKTPEPTWEEFRSQRSRGLTVVPPRVVKAKSNLPEIFLYLQHIQAIVDVEEASNLSGISKAILSRGKDPSLTNVAVLKWKRQKFFFKDTLPGHEGRHESEGNLSGHLQAAAQ